MGLCCCTKWCIPELRQFSELQQRDLLRRGRRTLKVRKDALPLVLALGGGFLLMGTVAAWTWFEHSSPAWAWRRDRLSAAGAAVAVLWMAASFAVAYRVALCAESFTVLDLLRTYFRTAGCPGCGYDTGGLPSTGGAARCPECGRRAPVRPAHASVDDLVRWLDSDWKGPAAPPTEQPRSDCPRCAYPVKGLPVTDGRAVCPECGETVLVGSEPFA